MSNKRILIIDDDPCIREILQICLSEVGKYQTIAAESGREGLVKAIVEDPDAIVLDICMPQMDGMEVLRKLRDCRNTSKTPVIILSAIASLISADALAKQGVVETISKPFNCLTLPERIATACNWNATLN